jgi:hypothetical protein
VAIRRFSISEPGVKSNRFWDQDTQQGAMVPLAHTILTANSGSVNFGSIPQIYQDLFLTASVRSDGNFTSGGFSAYINGSGTTGSSSTILAGNGSSAFSNRATTSSPVFGISFAQNIIPAATSTRGVFGTVHCHILDYTNTSKFKTSLLKAAADLNGSGNFMLAANLWANTNAVTDLNIQTNGNCVSGSTFTLYGIKAGA